MRKNKLLKSDKMLETNRLLETNNLLKANRFLEAKNLLKALKAKEGVSLITLVITIIIIIILAGIILYNGFTENIDEANFSKMYNEFIEVENAVAQRNYENKLDAIVYPFISGDTYSEFNPITINDVTYSTGYCLLTPTELETLGVNSVEREYVVNYLTGDVVLKEPYFWKDKEVYRKEDLLGAYTNNSLITKGEYDAEKGVNKPILLDGMLPVKWDGSNWMVCSTNDDEWYDYSIGSSGGPVRYANVMLLDDTSLRDQAGNRLSNETIRGMNV